MSELWNTFVEWYNGSGIDAVVQWAISAFMIIYNIVMSCKLKNSKINEISEVAKNKILCETINKNNNELLAQITANKAEIERNSETLSALLAVMCIILQNAKISPKSKQVAINIINDIGEKDKTTSDESLEILEKVIKEVNEEIEEEVKNENNTELDNLVGNLVGGEENGNRD